MDFEGAYLVRFGIIDLFSVGDSINPSVLIPLFDLQLERLSDFFLLKVCLPRVLV